MIRSITVTNHRGENLKMVLTRPEESGFAITNIDGLNPPSSNINTTDLVTADGGIFNSARMENRNIVITLVPMLGYSKSIEELRTQIYNLFPVKKRVRLDIETDQRNCYIYGYVESNDAQIFSSQVSCQVSIICPDPYIYDSKTQITLFSGDTPAFEYPYAHEYDPTLTYDVDDLCLHAGKSWRCVYAVTVPKEWDSSNWIEDPVARETDEAFVEFPLNDPLEFSIYSLDNMKSIAYKGEIDTGVIIKMHFYDAVTDIRIWNYYSYEEMDIDTTKVAEVVGSAIQNGDDIIISTIKGNKYIKFIRDGIEYNILNCINKDAIWMQLTLGDNVLCFVAASGTTNIDFQVENPILYQGV